MILVLYLHLQLSKMITQIGGGEVFVDVKYTNLMSSQLRNFKQKGSYLWNFSCPVCGDSSKNKLKARCFVYKMKEGLFVKCHNCGYSSSLGNLIKQVDSNLYQQYTLEKYKERVSYGHPTSIDMPQQKPVTLPEQLVDSVLDSVQRLDTLLPTHPALEYVRNRKFSVSSLSLLYYASHFKKFVNTVVPDKFRDEQDDHPRLIIPYFNRFGKCFAFQGRSFGDQQPKYYMIKLDEAEERIYGLDRVDFRKRIYVTEGPLDSLFIANAVAVSGSSFNTPTIEAVKTNATIVFDREPRSREIVKLISKTIDLGYSVCLLPETMLGKDVNEYIMNGMTSRQIVEQIDKHTFSGLQARLEFNKWKRV